MTSQQEAGALLPRRLKRGSEVRVIATARSLSVSPMTPELISDAQARLESLGLRVTFGSRSSRVRALDSPSADDRAADLHEAIRDESVRMILVAVGGFNCNEILGRIDYELIRDNPKIICGFSDTTALCNAVYAKTKLITYHGPHLYSLGEPQNTKYTLDYMEKGLFHREAYQILPSRVWSDDNWPSIPREDREFHENDGFWTINRGRAAGTILGGNQCTLNLLHGTEFMPNLDGSVLFLEDDSEAHAGTVDRDLQSIIHQTGFEGVKGVVFGRFERGSKIDYHTLVEIVKKKEELEGMPVVANVDFGHTSPIATVPIGGKVALDAGGKGASIRISQ